MPRVSRRIPRSLIWTGVTACLLATSLHPSPARARQDTPRHGPTDPVELAAFMDGLIETHLDAFDLVGGAVSVVRGDTLFFARGYGYADLEARRPVRADETLFRIGSISKLFVWTAVMQLVEQGRLDLDADVNGYLGDVQIPATYDEPVTLRHLMTHTAGFEDHVIGLFARDAARVRPLGDILAQELPARVRPPGDVASYSNHGTGLAALVVEQVSGMTWNDYVEQHILGPLGMTRTTFRQPVPESLAVSKGYAHRDGAFEEEGFEYVPLAPVGSASATATDMARFMRAHLGDGRLGAAQILDSTTAAQMRQPLFRHTPAVNAMAHGFIDMSRNGQRVVGHGGDTFWFHSMLALLPDHGVGLFVSYNTEGGGTAANKVYEAFMDRYYPAEIPDLTPPDDAGERLERFVGSYRANRYSHERLTKLAAAFVTLTVTRTDDGLLETDFPEPVRWIETAPLTFRKEDGLETLAFREDGAGRITHLFVGTLPFMAFERIGVWEHPAFHLALLVLTSFLFLATVVFWPLAAFLRKRHGLRIDYGGRIPIPARVLAWCTCLVFLAFAVGMAVVLSDPNEIVYGVPTALRRLLVLPILTAASTLGMLAYTVFLWRAKKGSLWSRVYYGALTVVSLVTLWQLYYWNLLGFQY